MTSSLSYPLINGCRHSFSSIELKLNGIIYVGFKSITYSRTRARTQVYGGSPDPLGKTRGKNEYKGECEMFLAEFNLLQASLASGYGDQFFTVGVTYTENGFDTISDTLIGCTLDSTDSSNSEGTDPTVRKFELAPLKILFNSIDDLAIPLVGVQS